MTNSMWWTEFLKTKLSPLCFWILIWQCLALWVGEPLLLPSPLLVGEELATLIPTPEFWWGVSATLYRVLLGLFYGIFCGLCLAVVTCGSVFGKIYLSPLVKMVQAIPVVSFILLLLLWTERNYVPVYVSALMIAPIICTSTAKGLYQRDPSLVEFAKVYGFSRWKVFRHISIPSAYPYFLSGLESAISLGWKSAVAAEVIALPPYSLGREMNQSKLYLETPRLFAQTLVVVVLSAVVGTLLQEGFARLGGRRFLWKSP